MSVVCVLGITAVCSAARVAHFHLQSTGLSPEAKLLLTIWSLANQETFRQIANRFGITRGYAHYLLKQYCHTLSALAQSKGIIRWPSSSEIIDLTKTNSFPGAFAAVDGCHIAIQTPLQHTDSYINRKSFASVILQGVCKPNLEFIDISTGWPGSMHDARIYRLSSLRQMLTSSVDENFHVLGNSAYPLEKCLMVPYRDDGHLTEKQKKFNYVLSVSRCSIERAFGYLKGKFQRLKYLDINDLGAVPSLITACCVLHNFILQTERDTVTQDDVEITESNIVTCAEVQSSADSVALRKRNDIASRL